MKVESKLVKASDSAEFEKKVQELNEMGFRIVCFHAVMASNGPDVLYAPMEREIPEPKTQREEADCSAA